MTTITTKALESQSTVNNVGRDERATQKSANELKRDVENCDLWCLDLAWDRDDHIDLVVGILLKDPLSQFRTHIKACYETR